MFPISKYELKNNRSHCTKCMYVVYIEKTIKITYEQKKTERKFKSNQLFLDNKH